MLQRSVTEWIAQRRKRRRRRRRRRRKRIRRGGSFDVVARYYEQLIFFFFWTEDAKDIKVWFPRAGVAVRQLIILDLYQQMRYFCGTGAPSLVPSIDNIEISVVRLTLLEFNYESVGEITQEL